MLHIIRKEMYDAEVFSLPLQFWNHPDEPELCLSQGGRFRSRGHFRWENLMPDWTLHLVDAGCGIMTADGVEYEVGAGDVFAFPPNVHMLYHDFPKTPWQYTWFSLKGRWATDLLADLGITKVSPLLRNGMSPELSWLVDGLVSKLGDTEEWRPTLPVAAAWRLIDAMQKQHMKNTAKSKEREDVATEAVRIIDSEYMACLGVDELAERLGISRATLFRRFKSKFGVPPKTYIDRRRLEKAHELLKCSGSSVTDIAATCGYSSVAHFIHAFRCKYGKPPATFRDAFHSVAAAVISVDQ